MPSDYISKSVLEKDVEENKWMNPCAKKAIFDALDTAKTLDLVPAPVKCGECLFWRSDGIHITGECKNTNVGKLKLDTDFCSYGERKEQK
jgi:hypothetical protein